MRITIKQLEERIRLINSLTRNKYKIHLYKTTGCGVNVVVNGEFQTEKNISNKEAMKLLDEMFGDEVRKIVREYNENYL
jgi:hypothetical protein